MTQDDATRDEASTETASPIETSFEIPVEGKKDIQATWSRPPHDHQEGKLSAIADSDKLVSLCFTHGAGGNHRAAVMEHFADGVGLEMPLLRFSGPLNLPSRVKQFHTVLGYLKQQGHTQTGQVVLGGRSMGARAAATAFVEMQPEEKVKSNRLVLQSYPLSGTKSSKTTEAEDAARRRQLLVALPPSAEVLFLTGSQDKLCPIELLNRAREDMSARSWSVVVEGADHGLEMKRLGKTNASKTVRQALGAVAGAWCRAAALPAHTEMSLSWNGELEQVINSGWTARKRGIREEANSSNTADQAAEDTQEVRQSKRIKR